MLRQRWLASQSEQAASRSMTVHHRLLCALYFRLCFKTLTMKMQQAAEGGVYASLSLSVCIVSDRHSCLRCFSVIPADVKRSSATAHSQSE